MFVVAYLPISARRPTLYFLDCPRFCLSLLIGFWTSRSVCAIAVEGTEVESTPVGSGSLSCAIAVEGTQVESAPVGSGSLSSA